MMENINISFNLLQVITVILWYLVICAVIMPFFAIIEAKTFGGKEYLKNRTIGWWLKKNLRALAFSPALPVFLFMFFKDRRDLVSRRARRAID